MKRIVTATTAALLSTTAMGASIFNNHETYGTILLDLDSPSSVETLGAQPTVGDSFTGDGAEESNGNRGTHQIFNNHENYGTILLEVRNGSQIAALGAPPGVGDSGSGNRGYDTDGTRRAFNPIFDNPDIYGTILNDR